jgi:hypothetical protein
MAGYACNPHLLFNTCNTNFSFLLRINFKCFAAKGLIETLDAHFHPLHYHSTA